MTCSRFLLIVGCLAVGPAYAQPARDAKIVVQRDVMYGRVHGAALLADFAHPEGKGPFPVILSVHGGRWVGSSKTDPGEGAIDVVRWAKFGFFAVSIDYRLVRCSAPPACYQDVLCAIRWLHAQADRYPIDRDRIFLIGMSAGGHLVSLAATLGDGPFPRTGGWEKHPTDFRGVISLSGPYDLEKLSWGVLWNTSPADDGVIARFGLLPEGKAGRAILDALEKARLEGRRLASPIRHVSAKTKPILILHSDNDGSVPVQQAVDMAEALAKAKAPHRLSIHKKKGHMRITEEVIKETLAFIEEVTKR